MLIMPNPPTKSQPDKFREAAKKAGELTEAQFNDQLGKVAKKRTSRCNNSSFANPKLDH